MQVAGTSLHKISVRATTEECVLDLAKLNEKLELEYIWR